MLRHIVSRLHIHNTLVFILTNTTRLYDVIFTYYHTIVYVTSNHCNVAINKYKGEYHLILYFEIAVLIIVSSTVSPSCCSLFYIYQKFISSIRIITLFQ